MALTLGKLTILVGAGLCNLYAIVYFAIIYQCLIRLCYCVFKLLNIFCPNLAFLISCLLFLVDLSLGLGLIVDCMPVNSMTKLLMPWYLHCFV